MGPVGSQFQRIQNRGEYLLRLSRNRAAHMKFRWIDFEVAQLPWQNQHVPKAFLKAWKIERNQVRKGCLGDDEYKHRALKHLVNSREVERTSESTASVFGSTVHQTKTGNSEPTTASPSGWACSFGFADWALAFWTCKQCKYDLNWSLSPNSDKMQKKSTWDVRLCGLSITKRSSVRDKPGSRFLTIFTMMRDLSIIGRSACREQIRIMISLQQTHFQDSSDPTRVTHHQCLRACVDRVKRDKSEFPRHSFEIVVQNNLFNFTELLKVLLPFHSSHYKHNTMLIQSDISWTLFNLKTVVCCDFCKVGDEESLMVRREFLRPWSWSISNQTQQFHLKEKSYLSIERPSIQEWITEEVDSKKWTSIAGRMQGELHKFLSNAFESANLLKSVKPEKSLFCVKKLTNFVVLLIWKNISICLTEVHQVVPDSFQSHQYSHS